MLPLESVGVMLLPPLGGVVVGSVVVGSVGVVVVVDESLGAVDGSVELVGAGAGAASFFWQATAANRAKMATGANLEALRNIRFSPQNGTSIASRPGQ